MDKFFDSMCSVVGTTLDCVCLVVGLSTITLALSWGLIEKMLESLHNRRMQRKVENYEKQWRG